MLELRQMEKTDAAGVERIEKESFAIPWSRQSFWEEALNERAYYLVAVWQEEIIGYAGIWLVAGEGQITNIAVAPVWRGRGVGRKLFTKLLLIAKERGAESATLEVRPSNRVALALYESLGFVDCGRRPGYYQDNGEDAVIMWKTRL